MLRTLPWRRSQPTHKPSEYKMDKGGQYRPLAFRVVNMPKARPVSLHPLTFDEAIKALISVVPNRVSISSKRRKKHKVSKRKLIKNAGS